MVRDRKTGLSAKNEGMDRLGGTGTRGMRETWYEV
jgi:hypothetical protein